MNAPAKLGGFALIVTVVFAAAVGVGSAVGPFDSTDSEVEHGGAHGGSNPGGDSTGNQAAEEIPGGLMVSQSGYTLSLTRDSLSVGEAVGLDFRILGPDGVVVTDYDVTHDKDLHLIVVRRDTTGFQHVHPELAEDGTWSVPVTLSPGQWRLFADFAPAALGDTIILGADLAVAGDYDPRPLPAPSATADVDGYTVSLDGELMPGQESELTLSVSKDGQPVTDLQPYLAAYGHLVALRDGDLAYLHVHPDGEPGDGITEPGPGITFYADVPSAGDYRLFLDFQHDGVVRTAQFTAQAGD